MGQGQSNPRKVTVINDEASGVIKISDSVVQRLKDEMEGGSRAGQQQQRQQGPSSGQQQQQQQSRQDDQEFGQTPPPPPPPAPIVIPQPPPAPFQDRGPEVRYVEEPSLSALKVRAEKEAELRQVEAYWQNRVQKLREHQLRSGEVNEEAFRKTVDELDKLFLKVRNKPVCQESRHAVLRCYRDNPGKSLLCSEAVAEFSKCVSSARLDSLKRNG